MLIWPWNSYQFKPCDELEPNNYTDFGLDVEDCSEDMLKRGGGGGGWANGESHTKFPSHELLNCRTLYNKLDFNVMALAP